MTWRSLLMNSNPIEIDKLNGGATLAFRTSMRPAPSFCQAISNLRLAPVRAAREESAEPVQIDATLAVLSRSGSHDAWLARRAGLSPSTLDFLWTAPRILPLAIARSGTEVRRGATLAVRDGWEAQHDSVHPPLDVVEKHAQEEFR